MKNPVNKMAKNTYIIFTDRRFAQTAYKELKNRFPESEFFRSGENREIRVFIGEIEGDAEEILYNVRTKKFSFVDIFMPVNARLGIMKEIHEEIIETLKSLLKNEQDKSFKIEVKKVDFRTELKAKEIEILIGEALERSGFRVDLDAPEREAFIVFLEKEVLISVIDTDKEKYILDYFREENKKRQNVVNRSEFKLREAIKFFGIDLTKVQKALDIGAAPGGWTHYLAEQGIKIAAVDNALLSYARLSEVAKLLVITDPEETENLKKITKKVPELNLMDVSDINTIADFGKYGIIHIKANLQPDKKIELLQKLGKFDLLTIDANIPAKECSYIANSLSELLNHGAFLVMTVKLTTRNINGYIRVINEELSKMYYGVSIKKLPYNREEFTAFAVRK